MNADALGKMAEYLPSLAGALPAGQRARRLRRRAAAATAYLEGSSASPPTTRAGAVQRSSEALKKDPEHPARLAQRASQAADARKGGRVGGMPARHTIALSVAAAAGGGGFGGEHLGATRTALGGRLILAGGADRNGVVHGDVGMRPG